MDTIYTATLRNCIAEQREQAASWLEMRALLKTGDLSGAIIEQGNARQAHEEMRIRLERLIGVC